MTTRTLEFDIVIIGSGAGGGTVAKELAPLCKKGAKIALLEWGARFRPEDNVRNELEMADKYYFESGGFPTASQDLTLAFARAVGGSTTVYTGTSLTAPKEVFEKWGVPGVTLEDLKPRYDKYIKENNVHLAPRDELNENNRLFEKGCKSLGWSVEQFPINTKGCIGLGTCNLGCAVHAKQGTAIAQIPVAEKGGVQVIPLCRVDRISPNLIEAQILPAEFGLTPSPLAPGPIQFRAKKIVVCGGSVQSSALLLRSFGDVALPALGRYFSCHPALILAGEHPQPIQNIQGHPKSFFCDEFFDSDRFLLETCMYFPFTLAKNLVGYGEELDDLMSNFNRLQMILVLAIDPALRENRVALDRSGNPIVHYRFSEEVIGSLLQAIRKSAKIFFAAGAARVHAPAAGRFFVYPNEAERLDQIITRDHFKLGQLSIAAAHLMGGCRMGEDIETSVTDSWGRVHGMKDVYVADSSLFPGPSEVNPYLTIMALADRVAQGICKDMGVNS